MPERYELSLMTVVHWLNSAGMIVLNVCGRMMWRMVAKKPKPWLCAASNWPRGIELRPPRTISAITALVNSVKAMVEITMSKPCTVK